MNFCGKGPLFLGTGRRKGSRWGKHVQVCPNILASTASIREPRTAGWRVNRCDGIMGTSYVADMKVVEHEMMNKCQMVGRH